MAIGMIDKFRAHFAAHSDWSKACRFEASFFAPPCLNGKTPVGLRMQCETAELPGYNINTVDGKVYGSSYAVAATPVFNDLNLTFICAGDLWEKKFFDEWMEIMMNKDRYGFNSLYREEYVTSIEIKQYDETHGQLVTMASNIPGISKVVNKIEQYLDVPAAVQYHAKFVEIFPTSVAPISLNWAEDSINRLNVTFKYRYWTQIQGTGVLGQFKNMIKNTGLKF